MMNAMPMLQAAATNLIAVHHKSNVMATEYRQKEYLKAEKDGRRSRINREGSVLSFRLNLSLVGSLQSLIGEVLRF
jgi:hypothetical protein